MIKTFEVNGKKIGKKCDPFIIAEAGINHNGDIELAKKMILAAKECGVDAVKFQTFHAEEFIQDETITYTYQSQGREVTESMLEMFHRNEFSESEWIEIKNYCDEQKIIFLSTPQNVSDLYLLLKLGIEAVKVGSDDFVNIPLIRKYSKEKLPLLLSCGMATDNEIKKTLETVREINSEPIVLLLCTSEYPTPSENVNILKLKTMKKKYKDVILGFSDHTQGTEAAVMAIALGARVFEKHFTLSHDLPGPDHWFSEEPTGLAAWTGAIRRAYQMLGDGSLIPTEAEKEMRQLAHRSITAIVDIQAGEIFSEAKIDMRRPGTGIPASEWDLVIGKKAVRNIKAGEQLSWEDIDE